MDPIADAVGSATGAETIGSAFRAAAAARNPDDPWLTLVSADGQDRPYSTSAVRAEVDAWRNWFAAAVGAPGDRVAICLEPSIGLYAAFLGAILAGAVPSIFAPPSPKQKREDTLQAFRLLLDASGSRMLVTTIADFAELAGERLVVSPDSLERGAPQAPEPDLDPDAVAFVQYSSGTTGLKKGVAVTHRALAAHITAYGQSIGLSRSDRIASWLPLYHDMGLITALFTPLLTGLPLVAMSPLDWASNPTLLLAAIERHRATVCWQPNFAYNFLARFKARSTADLSSMRLWINCSERVLAESHAVFRRAFAEAGVRHDSLGTCYAMAENVFAVTSSRPGAVAWLNADPAALSKGVFSPATAPGSANAQVLLSSGTPLPDVSVRILDASERPLPDGQVGEIAIRTPWLFSGYSGVDEARFVDGHFLTGDTGFLDRGDLFVLGRKKDVLIIAGRNIYPQDIEALVDEAPGVVPGRCAAFAVPDEATGTEGVVILAETRETDLDGHPQIVQAIRAKVAAGVGVVPDAIELRPHMSLIKSTSGKISRGLNRDAYVRQSLERTATEAGASGVTSGSTDLRGKVRAVVAAVVRRKPLGNLRIEDDDSLFELGVIDSLSFIELTMELERAIGRPAPERMVRDALAYDSVGAIAKCFEEDAGPPSAAESPSTAEDMFGPMRRRRLELAPQFRDTDGVLLEPLPYLMLTPTRNYSSATANSDSHGFRVAIKDGELLTQAQFAALPGDKGIVLGNSMSWGTGASEDANVLHNVLNREMADTAWYSYALRQSVLTQERLAANLFAPLDVAHVVWVTGSVLVANALTRISHADYLPFPTQLRFEASLGRKPRYEDKWTVAQRAREILPHMAREMELLSRVYAGARNRLFVWQPTLMHYDKPMGAEERELLDIAQRLPGKPANPSRIRAQKRLSAALGHYAKGLAAEHGLKFVDPSESEIFRSSEWLFVDPEHLNDAGISALAEIVRANLD